MGCIFTANATSIPGLVLPFLRPTPSVPQGAEREEGRQTRLKEKGDEGRRKNEDDPARRASKVACGWSHSAILLHNGRVLTFGSGKDVTTAAVGRHHFDGRACT